MIEETKLKRIRSLLRDLEYEFASGLHQNLIDEQLMAETIIGGVSREFPAWMMWVVFKPMTEYEVSMLPAERKYEGLVLVKG